MGDSALAYNYGAASLSPRRYGAAGNWTEDPIGYGSASADFSDLSRTNPSGGSGAVAGVPAFGGGWGSSFARNPSSGAGGAASASSGPVSLLRTSKSDSGNSALESILGHLSGLSNDLVQPLLRSTRDQAQQSDIATSRANYASGRDAGQQRLADWTNEFYQNRGQDKAQTDQDISAIGDYYGGPNSVESNLSKLLAQRRVAVQGALNRGLMETRRQQNLARLGLGGDSSYTNQQFMDTASGILSNESQQEAELARNNFLAVKDAQTKLAGTRSGLLQSYLQRGLSPIDAGQRFASGDLANLGTLGGISNANNLYQTPEQLYASRLGLLGQYGADLNSLNFFGLGGNFPNPAQRWGNPGGGGGYGDSGYGQPIPGYAPDPNFDPFGNPRVRAPATMFSSIRPQPNRMSEITVDPTQYWRFGMPPGAPPPGMTGGGGGGDGFLPTDYFLPGLLKNGTGTGYDYNPAGFGSGGMAMAA